VLDTFSRPGGRLQSAQAGDLAVLRPGGLTAQPPDPEQLADAVARYQAYQALREFRAGLCLVRGAGFPGAAQVGGERAGDQELGGPRAEAVST